MKLDRNTRMKIAAGLKHMNPELTPEEIHRGIRGLESSTPAQRLAWALEDRERASQARTAETVQEGRQADA